MGLHQPNISQTNLKDQGRKHSFQTPRRVSRYGECPICNHQKGSRDTDDGIPTLPIYLNSLGMITDKLVSDASASWLIWRLLFSQSTKGSELTDDGHPQQMKYLNNLG